MPFKYKIYLKSFTHSTRANQRNLGFQVYLTEKTWIHEGTTSRLYKSLIYYKFFESWFSKSNTKQKTHWLHEAREKEVGPTYTYPSLSKYFENTDFCCSYNGSWIAKKTTFPFCPCGNFLRWCSHIRSETKVFPQPFNI